MISGVAVFAEISGLAFHQIEQFDLLRDLYREMLAPTVVAQEVAPSLGTLPGWIHVEADFPAQHGRASWMPGSKQP